jgi:hypothetical protein
MKFIFWGGMLLFIGSILLLSSTYENLDVEKKGKIVKMRIEKLPSSCLGTRFDQIATLSFHRKYYTKKIGVRFCDLHYAGEEIDVKYLEGSSTILFPNESLMPNFFSIGFLGVIGLVIALFQWDKMKKRK